MNIRAGGHQRSNEGGIVVAGREKQGTGGQKPQQHHFAIRIGALRQQQRDVLPIIRHRGQKQRRSVEPDSLPGRASAPWASSSLTDSAVPG